MKFPNRVGRNGKQRPNSQSARDSNRVESEWQEVKSKEVGKCQRTVAEKEAGFYKTGEAQ